MAKKGKRFPTRWNLKNLLNVRLLVVEGVCLGLEQVLQPVGQRSEDGDGGLEVAAEQPRGHLRGLVSMS